MKRLAAIMPKKPEPPKDGKLAMRIEMNPIRQSAEAFASWIDDDLPTNIEEIIAMLWVFGERLNGEMERRLNHVMKLQEDLLATMPFSTSTIKQTEALDGTQPKPAL
jgi:hypothetical protein